MPVSVPALNFLLTRHFIQSWEPSRILRFWATKLITASPCGFKEQLDILFFIWTSVVCLCIPTYTVSLYILCVNLLLNVMYPPPPASCSYNSVWLGDATGTANSSVLELNLPWDLPRLTHSFWWLIKNVWLLLDKNFYTPYDKIYRDNVS